MDPNPTVPSRLRTNANEEEGRLGNGWRASFDTPIRYAWITLLVPTLYALKYAIGDFDPYPGYPAYLAAWAMFFVPFALMVVPMQLLYQHLPEVLRPADLTAPRAIPFNLALVVACGSLGGVVGGWIVEPWMPPVELDPTREWRELPMIAFLVMVFGTPVFLRGVSYRALLAASRLRESRARQEALTAQVQALQARIEPHSLFNGLNAVAGLIREDPERAECALEHLAGLFRYALDASNSTLVPLADELEAVESYLELSRLRFRDRLATSVRVPPDVSGVLVPALFLQPLVENAVQHGVGDREGAGCVEIEVQRDDALRVRVEDDGPGPGGSVHVGARSALDDLSRRLELLYGDRASLAFDRGPLGGFRVQLAIPLDGRGESSR